MPEDRLEQRKRYNVLFLLALERKLDAIGASLRPSAVCRLTPRVGARPPRSRAGRRPSGGPGQSGAHHPQASHRYPAAPLFRTLPQVSRRVTVRLNTGAPGAWSLESATK